MAPTASYGEPLPMLAAASAAPDVELPAAPERRVVSTAAMPACGTFADDPVLSALRRYKASAGSSFKPPSEVDDSLQASAGLLDNRVKQFNDWSVKAERELEGYPQHRPSPRYMPHMSTSSSSTASGSPNCMQNPMDSDSFLEGEGRHAICGLGASPTDIRGLLPSWLSWMNPWLEPSAPDFCGAVPQSKVMHVFSANAVSDPWESGQPNFSSSVTEGADDSNSSHVSAPKAAEAILERGSFSLPEPTAIKRLLPPTRPGQKLEAIKELPVGFRSSTYEELDGPEKAKAEGMQLPDCSTEGLELGAEIADHREGGWGIGKLRRGRVGGSVSMVTELRLPKPLDSYQNRRLGAALRSRAFGTPRNDLARPMGAVPANDGHPGVFVAWEDSANSSFGSSSCSTTPLPQALRVEPPRGDQWRLTVARQLCVAIDALHRSGASHGSLAPRNVLVTSTGDICVNEAGLVDALIHTGALREHDLLGVLGLQFARYVAPEGWHVPRSGGMAADLFALGLVLLEVLDGAGPPNAECQSLQQLSAKMLPKRGRWSPAISMTGLFGSLPKATRSTIQACFSEEPTKRPSAQQLLFSLAAPEDACAEEFRLAASPSFAKHFQTKLPELMKQVPETLVETSPQFQTLLPSFAPESPVKRSDMPLEPLSAFDEAQDGQVAMQAEPRQPDTGSSPVKQLLEAGGQVQYGQPPLPPPPPRRVSCELQAGTGAAPVGVIAASERHVMPTSPRPPSPGPPPLPPPPPMQTVQTTEDTSPPHASQLHASPCSSQDSRPPSPPLPVEKSGSAGNRLAAWQMPYAAHRMLSREDASPSRQDTPPPPEPPRY